MSMREILFTRYGKRVVDCFEGTPVQPIARRLGTGLWLVRDAVEADRLEMWDGQLHEGLDDIIKQKGPRAVAAEGHTLDTIKAATTSVC